MNLQKHIYLKNVSKMKKILLNYLKPQVRVYQVNTENLLQITSPNSIPDNDDYDNDGDGFTF